MLTLNATSDFKRKLIFSGYRSTYTAELSLKEGSVEIPSAQIGEFGAQFIEHCPKTIPLSGISCNKISEIESISLIDNLRGRPAEAFNSGKARNIPSNREPREEELLYLEGEIIQSQEDRGSNKTEELRNDNVKADNDSPPSTLPINYSIRSRFHSFKAGAIIHQLYSQASESLLAIESTPSPLIICRHPRITINVIRFGCEFYCPRFLGSTFGRLPSITLRFYLELDRISARITAEEELSSREKKVAGMDSGLLPAVEKCLNDSGLYAGSLSP